MKCVIDSLGAQTTKTGTGPMLEFADNTLHVILTEMVGFFSYRIEKIVGKKRKCWLSEFSPFLTEEFYKWSNTLAMPIINLNMKKSQILIFHDKVFLELLFSKPNVWH